MNKEITAEEEEKRQIALLKMYLEQYSRKRKRKNDLSQRLGNFREEMFGNKAISCSTMPKSQTNRILNEPLDFRIRCEEIEERIEKERKSAASSMLKVMDVLDFLDESIEKDILEYRYLDGYQWKTIEKKMSLCRSRCIDYHNIGMKKLIENKKIRTTLEEFERKIEGRGDDDVSTGAAVECVRNA